MAGHMWMEKLSMLFLCTVREIIGR